MVVRPEDCTLLAKKEKQWLADAVSKIDNTLREKFYEGERIDLHVGPPKLIWKN